MGTYLLEHFLYDLSIILGFFRVVVLRENLLNWFFFLQFLLSLVIFQKCFYYG